jgi:hypothetical protein
MKLSLMGILNESKGKLLYSAVVLDEVSRKQLLSFVKDFVLIPSEWKIINHHMTIGFKKPVPDELKDYIGKNIDLRVKEIGVSDDAIAVKVEGFFTYNEIPHITIAIPKNGKPSNSNLITNWMSIPNDREIIVSGVVIEILS